MLRDSEIIGDYPWSWVVIEAILNWGDYIECITHTSNLGMRMHSHMQWEMRQNFDQWQDYLNDT